MLNRFEPAICGCCGRMAIGIGYKNQPTQNNQPILWLCDDVQCIEVARKTYPMKQSTFNRIESLAAGKGGEEGGAYLEQIGKTDLTLLSLDEWFEFCRRIIAGYRNALKHDLHDEAPF